MFIFLYLLSLSYVCIYVHIFILIIIVLCMHLCSQQPLQDLTVLPTEFFHRRKTHILSVINLPTKSPTEMLCQ